VAAHLHPKLSNIRPGVHPMASGGQSGSDKSHLQIFNPGTHGVFISEHAGRVVVFA